MRRASSLVLLCLALVLAFLPLGAARPGMPLTLKADEPAYYLAALSLAFDHDLRCEPRDLARLWEEFPYEKTRNLILMTDDGWQTAYFGKPYVYSLLTAPFAALFGASGMVSANLLMLAAMIAMGTSYLRRYNRDVVALLFAAGFFLLSTTFAYAFWLQPELYNMTAVCAGLYLGLVPERGKKPRHLALRLALSGAALALAAYNKPILALLGLPVFLRLLKRDGLRTAGSWIAGALLAAGLQAGGGVLLTGHPSAYLGVARAGVSVETPDRLPIDPTQPAGNGEEVLGARNSWLWIFRIPRVDLHKLVENFGYFLWGRHVGLLPYLPFAAVALLLFLLQARRSRLRWGLLASLVGVALFFFIWIDFNWHGGGGFVGNRYFLNAYPAFLFLVTRIRPRALLPVAWAAGGLLLGPILLTPYGAPVRNPTLQAHTRNFPFDRLPLEQTLLGGIPGYQGVTLGDVWVYGRRDQLLPRGERIWLHGGQRAELWLTFPEAPTSVVFEVRAGDPDRPPTLTLGTDRRRLEPGPGARQVEFRPGEPDRMREQGAMYRLVVEMPGGRTEHYLSPTEQDKTFYLGVDLAILGPRERLERDVFGLQWHGCDAPPAVAAGELFRAEARVVNHSRELWPATGTVRVALSYHWRSADGEVVQWEGIRSSLPRDLPVEDGVRAPLEVLAPETPGHYLLEIDPVYEHVAWFSSRNGGRTCRLEVAVGPAAPDAPRDGAVDLR